MPRLRHKTLKERGWTKAHKEQLRYGYDWFHGAWGHPSEDDWPPEIEDEMRAAWEHFRDELMEETKDTLTRPWAWWWIDFPEQFPDVDPIELRTLSTSSSDYEAEALDRLGLLTRKALKKAAADPMTTRGILNEAHNAAFRRVWGWWRFVSPERRDYSRLEAVQLVELERKGGEVLSGREQHIVTHKADVPVYAVGCAIKVRLPRAEVEALELPAEFIEDED